MNYTPKTKEWFIERIGKRIYRDKDGCCAECDFNAENGVIVEGEFYAEQYALVDAEFAACGTFMNYRDEK